MTSKIGQISISADNVVSSNGVCQRKKIEVFGVANSCRRNLSLNSCKLTERINDGKQICHISISDIFTNLLTASYIPNLHNEAAADIYIKTLVCQHLTNKSRLMPNEKRNPKVCV